MALSPKMRAKLAILRRQAGNNLALKTPKMKVSNLQPATISPVTMPKTPAPPKPPKF